MQSHFRQCGMQPNYRICLCLNWFFDRCEICLGIQTWILILRYLNMFTAAKKSRNDDFGSNGAWLDTRFFSVNSVPIQLDTIGSFEPEPLPYFDQCLLNRKLPFPRPLNTNFYSWVPFSRRWDKETQRLKVTSPSKSFLHEIALLKIISFNREQWVNISSP